MLPSQHSALRGREEETFSLSTRKWWLRAGLTALSNLIPLKIFATKLNWIISFLLSIEWRWSEMKAWRRMKMRRRWRAVWWRVRDKEGDCCTGPPPPTSPPPPPTPAPPPSPPSCAPPVASPWVNVPRPFHCSSVILRCKPCNGDKEVEMFKT